MMEYSLNEMVDMHLFYGRSYGNAFEARRLYALAFPRRRVPCHKTFIRIDQRLRDIGSLKPRKIDSGRQRNDDSFQKEEKILDCIKKNPSTSTRRISNEVAFSKSIVSRILNKNGLYPYHLQRVQSLLPRDFDSRVNFSQWLLERCDHDPLFLSSIMFTDEAGFNQDGIFNFHNKHIWSESNPHEICESKHQHQYSINVWAGIIGDSLIGPYILPNRLNGAAYRNFLENTLPNLIEDIPLKVLRNMWFMHDGAPAHFSKVSREYLDRRFAGRWLGRSGPINWPARSPDLNPLDFFFWGFLKEAVYATPVTDVDNLKQRVFKACEDIRNRREIFERVRHSMMQRLKSCIEAGGQHFEHLL